MAFSPDWILNPTVVVASILLLTIIWYRKQKGNALPPGPWGLPILGVLPFMGNAPHTYLAKQGEKYGHIFTIQMGMRTVVIIHSLEAMKEMMTKGTAFNGRPSIPWKKVTGTKGLIMNDPPDLTHLKRWTISMFRDFGMGKKTFEGSINDEIGYLVEKMRELKHQNNNLNSLVFTSMANVTHRVLFGYRRNLDDPILLEIINNVDEVLKTNSVAGAGQFFPFLRYVPFLLDGPMRKLEHGLKSMNKHNFQEIQKHKESFNPDDINDLIDAYLLQMSKVTGDSVFTEENLMQILTDMCIGGFDTTTTTIMWGILFLIHYPDVQRRCIEEISEQIGQDRPPSMADKLKLPYVEATINEIQRVGDIAPLIAMRQCLETTEVFGYVIPAGTWLIPSLASRLTDPSVWREPEKFDPTRFLDENGKVLKSDHFIPFSIGKRECAGQTLAKQELFLYLTTLMQKFTFHPPEGMPMPKLEALPPTFIVPPIPYEVRITEN